MPQLTNMKFTSSERDDFYASPGDDKGPKYPYGLSLSLDEESLKKLKLDSLPDVGSEMGLVAVVRVTRKSESESEEGGDYKDVSLQITKMSLHDELPDKKSNEEKFYPEDK